MASKIKVDTISEKTSSGDLTLDVAGDIILDADGDDLIFAAAGTNLLKVTNSSSDVVFQPQVDAKDIKFNQYDGRTLLDINDGGYVGIANGATGPGQLRLYEDTDNGTNYTAFQVGTQSGDITYTLPTADGSNGHFLSTNGSGTLSWGAAAFSVSDITGATALAEQPALTDEIILSDAGSLKRLDIKHISNTPAVSVRPSGNQTISNNTWTKVSLQTEVVDSDSTFDSSTNYRWTPGIEGYYQISVSVGGTGGTAYGFEKMWFAIYKNGSALHSMSGQWDNRNGSLDTGFLSATQIVYSDADDYFELYYKFNDTGSSDSNTLHAANTRFAGCRVTGV